MKCEGYNTTNQTMALEAKGYYNPTLMLYDYSESKYEEIKNTKAISPHSSDIIKQT